jgi:hypothetical protein
LGDIESESVRIDRALRDKRAVDIEDIIRAKEKAINDNLKQIESEYKRQIQVAIDTCESMERLAAEDHRLLDIPRYRIQAQIYKQLLANYTLSNSYNRP